VLRGRGAVELANTVLAGVDLTKNASEQSDELGAGSSCPRGQYNSEGPGASTAHARSGLTQNASEQKLRTEARGSRAPVGAV